MKPKNWIFYGIIALLLIAIGFGIGRLSQPTPRFVQVDLWMARDIYNNCEKWESALEEWQLKNLPAITQMTSCSTWFMPVSKKTNIIY